MNSTFLYTKSPSRKYLLTDEGYNYLKRRLIEGASFSALSKIFDINPDTLAALAKENGIHVDNRRKYLFDVTYFDKVDSPEKSYWLGFLMADGNVDKTKSNTQLILQRQDELSLYKFRNCLGLTAPVRDKIAHVNGKDFPLSCLCISSRHFCESLVKLGCVPNKSLILKPPRIDDNLVPYWILGYMDGDGSISVVSNPKYLRLSIRFTGTYEVLSFIKDYFKNGVSIRKEHRCENTFNYFVTEGKAIPFLSEMYNTESLGWLSLDRKREKFIHYMNLREYKET